MTWIKTRSLVASYHVLRWLLRQTVRVEHLVRDIIPGLKFYWIGKVARFILDAVVMPLKLSLAGTLESILITQRRIP